MPQPLHLYVHIPFCATKCFYCAFFSQEGQEKWIEPYVAALIKEIKLTSETIKNHQVVTLYFGGGTPSLLPAKLLAEIITTIRGNFAIAPDAEITIEANPESITAEKLATYHQAGCTRLSIGLQAWQSRLLTELNRPYQIADFQRVIEIVKNSPLKNFNLDLIFGLPNQTLADWQESVTNTIACQPNHISCYSLELDNSSKFGRLWQQGKLKIPKSTLDRQMYEFAKKTLHQAGYQQYEISNFATVGNESQHNLAFWHNQPYLGLGAGAESYWQGQSWQNVANISQYCKLLSEQILPRHTITTETKLERAQAGLVLGLRLHEGIFIPEFAGMYGKDLVDWLSPALTKLVKNRSLAIVSNRLRLTEVGKNIINQVLVELLSSTTP